MAFALRGMMAAAATRPLLSTRLLGLRAFASEGAAGSSAEAAAASGLVKLYVGNLSWSTTTAHLEEAFRSFGPVTDAIVLSDRFTGRSRGSGFVTMDATAAEKAIQEMNQREFMGRTIRVEVSTPRDPNAERPPRRNRDGGGGGGYGGGGGGGGYGRGPRQYGGGGGGQDY